MKLKIPVFPFRVTARILRLVVASQIAMALVLLLVALGTVAAPVRAGNMNSPQGVVSFAQFTYIAYNNTTQPVTSTGLSTAGYSSQDCYHNIAMTGTLASIATTTVTFQHSIDGINWLTDYRLSPLGGDVASTTDFSRSLLFGTTERVIVAPLTTNIFPITGTVTCVFKNNANN